jgi:PPK2 family polyphosphate:nucleotide phosphotransferase
MTYCWKFERGERVDLSKLDPGHCAALEYAAAAPLLQTLHTQLDEIQELCYAAASHAVLIVLQGMDTSGKDGTIENVMASVDPQGCLVTAFKVPTPEERAHDFLWRVHAATPSKGMFVIFNRSHYEDVLVVRVCELAPEAVWKARYDHINRFEQLMADEGTIVLKFFLHISKEEQAVRLRAREKEKDKRWKLALGDYEQRRHWEAYRAAYQDVLERCSAPHAPWYVVPADRKWFRNLAVADAIVGALRPYRAVWKRALLERGERNYQELLSARQRGAGML